MLRFTSLWKNARVAPFAGAWIEIGYRRLWQVKKCVAPFAGAWIEIRQLKIIAKELKVAPFAGAWIEIIQPYKTVRSRLRRSLRGSVD